MSDQFTREAVAEYRARMRPRTVIMMAGGPQRRWPEPQRKHLAAIRGEPLIERTMRQLAENDVAAPVVVAETALSGLADVAFRESRGGYLDALLGTRDLWRGGVLVLSADVVFSDTALRAILSTAPSADHAWAVFGKRHANAYTGKPWSELYALRFADTDTDRLVAAIDGLRAMPHRRQGLHALYRTLAGLTPPHRPHLPPGPLFHDVPDWTDDVDSRSDYDNIVGYLEENPDAAL